MSKICKAIFCVVIASLVNLGAANAKDEDYTTPTAHFIKSVTEATFHEEVIDSLTPVVLDVCDNCASSVDRTEKLAVHFSGKARFFQLPAKENKTFSQRLVQLDISWPIYVVAIGEHLFFPARKDMTDVEVKAFIESILSSNT